jgi:hypothetical protein
VNKYAPLLAIVLLANVAVQASAGSSASPPPAHPLQTALDDPETFAGPEADLALARTRGAGATAVKLVLFWNSVAPGGAQPPQGFDPANPNDPAYNWSSFDAELRTAVSRRLEPIVQIWGAPPWAERPPPGRSDLTNWDVDPNDLAQFAEAAAERYDGSFQDLPRVRYWQVWNEPNLSVFFNPQLSTQLTQKPSCPFDPTEAVSPDLYRAMVNDTAAALHQVRPDNVVIAGGLSPFCGTSGVVAMAPLLFMRKLLCMSNDPVPRPTCSAKVSFDIWAANPYTAGGPTHKAWRPDDVSIGNLPEMNRLLQAAIRAGHVQSTRPVGFWVTEFGWDTKPPDTGGVPLALHARWVAEALYRMWLDGITLVTWFALRDEAPAGRAEAFVIQSGLYFRGDAVADDRPKPALRAFRFPMVAFEQPGPRILVWGRTPWGRSGSVVIEQSWRQGWRLVGRVSTDRYGVFYRTLQPRGPGLLVRARLAGSAATSVPFSLRRPPDLLVNPFGGPYARTP